MENSRDKTATDCDREKIETLNRAVQEYLYPVIYFSGPLELIPLVTAIEANLHSNFNISCP